MRLHSYFLYYVIFSCCNKLSDSFSIVVDVTNILCSVVCSECNVLYAATIYIYIVISL